MRGIIEKVLKWIPMNLVSILAFAQAIIKFGKEVATAAINILFPVIPSAAFQAVVRKVRDFFELLDGWVERIKGLLLKVGLAQ